MQFRKDRGERRERDSFDGWGTFISLLTHSLQESPIRLNLSSVKNHVKERLTETEENKKVLSLFPTWKAHYSSSFPHLKSDPLLYLTSLFFFLVPASPPHKPTLYEWLASLSSTPAPPPFSHWLFHSLNPTTPPSFPFSSPLLFLSVSLHCWLFTPASWKPKSSSVRLPLIKL